MRRGVKAGLKLGLAVLAVLLGSGLSAHAASTTLADGTYSVPVQVVQDQNGKATTTASVAAKYVDQTATAQVKAGKAQMTLPLKSEANRWLSAVKVAGNSATISTTDLTFGLSQLTSPVAVTFSISLPTGGTQTQPAWFSFDWAKAKAAATSSSSTSSSSSTPVRSTDQAAQSTTPTTKAVTAKTATPQAATKTSTAEETDGWTYQVLQANGKTVSAANKFYTHVAVVTPVQDHYQVQLSVKYAKNSGMTQKGFKPLTTNGEPAKNVVYGASGNYYTVSYTFDVATLKDLDHLIKGTMHIVVPTVGINQQFTVQFKFSHHGTTATAQKGAATPVTATQKKAHAAAAKSTLPQTGDHVATSAVVAGFLGLVSGIVIWKRGK